MQERIFNFKDDIKVGEKGEKLFLSHINKFARQNKIELEDVSNEEEYQQMDIDFILVDKNKKYALEFKTDTYDSGNMFYEEYSAIETRSAGCFHKTKANVILYYFIKTDTLYTIYNVDAFRDWYEENINRFRHHKIKNRLGKDKIYNAYGGLIPLKEMELAMEGKFGTKSSLKGESPENILNNIRLAVAFGRNENIAISTKTTYRPIFNLEIV